MRHHHDTLPSATFQAFFIRDVMNHIACTQSLLMGLAIPSDPRSPIPDRTSDEDNAVYHDSGRGRTSEEPTAVRFRVRCPHVGRISSLFALIHSACPRRLSCTFPSLHPLFLSSLMASPVSFAISAPPVTRSPSHTLITSPRSPKRYREQEENARSRR